MTTTSCPTWAQDCHDCGQSIPGGTWRQYVDDTSLRVRHINGCPPAVGDSCCLCRRREPGYPKVFATLERTSLPGTGYRCNDRGACAARAARRTAGEQQ